MTDRQILCLQMFFEALQDAGQPTAQNILFAMFSLKLSPRPSMTEFEQCLRLADGNGWLTSLPSKVTKQTLWTLNDAGRAAAMEL